MRWRIGDILACPECAYSPLRIHDLKTVRKPPGDKSFIHPCEHFCARLNLVISESLESRELPCARCREDEILEALLFCPQCHRWFSTMDGIPHLVRDGLRIIEAERELLKKYSDTLPLEIIEDGIPHSLSGSTIASGEQDLKMLDEGVFWGEFFNAFYERGDRSILDIRVRGTHPMFLNYGVEERHDLEKYKPWGPWPAHLGSMLFTPLKETKGKRGLDFGCGGGQFGLEAAYEGVDMTGFDISPAAVGIAREYAQSIGIDSQYVYAEAQNLPFRKQIFSLLMAKDSLHHLDDPKSAIKKVKPTLIPDALVIIIEHAGNSPFVKFVYDMFARRLVPRIQRRYPHVDIPSVLLEGAPNEDMGIKHVERNLKENFYIVRERREWLLYLRLEQLVYYAFGKRRRLTNAFSRIIYIVERLCIKFGAPDHIAIIGRHRM